MITHIVLAGHQRLIAARRLNWLQIKAIVLEVSELDAEMLLIRDNLFRRHMGGMELARALDAYSRLSDNQTHKSIRQIEQETGENRNTVHFYIRLNNLITEFQKLLENRKLSPTAAQVFTSMSEEEQRDVYNALGESIVGMKKKGLEDEIRRQYQDELLKIQEDNKQISDERDKLFSDISSKDIDITHYRAESETYRQQAGEFKDKALAADISEEIRAVLSKLDVIDSITASICLSSCSMYDENSISLLEKRLNNINAYLSSLSCVVSAVTKNTQIDGND